VPAIPAKPAVDGHYGYMQALCQSFRRGMLVFRGVNWTLRNCLHIRAYPPPARVPPRLQITGYLQIAGTGADFGNKRRFLKQAGQIKAVGEHGELAVGRAWPLILWLVPIQLHAIVVRIA
jgi:hypothetical protein